MCYLRMEQYELLYKVASNQLLIFNIGGHLNY